MATGVTAKTFRDLPQPNDDEKQVIWNMVEALATWEWDTLFARQGELKGWKEKIKHIHQLCFLHCIVSNPKSKKWLRQIVTKTDATNNTFIRTQTLAKVASEFFSNLGKELKAKNDQNDLKPHISGFGLSLGLLYVKMEYHIDKGETKEFLEYITQ